MKVKRKFEIIEDAMDYVERIFEYKGSKICEVNCEDWFEQYDIEEETESNPSDYIGSFYVPSKLFEDIDHYYLKCPYGTYEAYALYETTQNYIEEFDNEEDCLNWLVG